MRVGARLNFLELPHLEQNFLAFRLLLFLCLEDMSFNHFTSSCVISCLRVSWLFGASPQVVIACLRLLLSHVPIEPLNDCADGSRWTVAFSVRKLLIRQVIVHRFQLVIESRVKSLSELVLLVRSVDSLFSSLLVDCFEVAIGDSFVGAVVDLPNRCH